MNPRHNGRILLVDDTPSIHDDFRKILGPHPVSPALAGGETALFGTPAPQCPEFEIDSAHQGHEGLARVQGALAAGRPYAMAFVDMRMPPGWDGLETVERLWQADPRLQIVICTAYSDHPWEEVLERLDVQDRLLILKKPFDMIEVSQLARTMTAKWALARRADDQMKELEVKVRQLHASDSELRFTSHELQAFAHSISHDLQSPLALIASFSALLAAELQTVDGKAKHYLNRIMASATVGQELISGLLALTHIARAQLKIEKIDIAGLVRQLISELQSVAPARKAVVTVEPGLSVWGDARLMGIAIRNLVENAWKFSSAREVTVIEVGLAQDTCEQSIFFVRDNGCGFDMAYADKLFKNFQRLHGRDEYPGTGVGLVTVSRVLARHGGRVWGDSVPGEGSTFCFSLPHGPAVPGRAEVAQARTQE